MGKLLLEDARFLDPEAPTWTIAAAALAIGWLLGSLWFQGGAFLHIESQSFVQHYLAQRDFLPTIFDVRRNDWGWYQARELSYVVDWLDAHAILASIRVGLAHFHPVSHYAVVLMIVGLHFRWGRRWFPQLHPGLLLLLAAVFLSSSHSFFASYFRSSKDLVSLAVYALAGLAFVGPAVRRETQLRWRPALGIFGIAVAMTLFDRQGVFFSIAALGIAVILYAAERNARFAMLSGVLVASLAVSEFNNRALTPALIRATNGYEPNLHHQSLDFVGRDLAALAGGSGLELLIGSGVVVIDVVGGFFGSLGTIGGALALLALFACAWRTPASDAIGVGQRALLRHRHALILVVGLLGLWSLSWVMCLKQGYMLQPENRVLYYWAPLNALLLLIATSATARVVTRYPGAVRVFAVALGVLVVSNFLAIPRHLESYIYPESSWIGPQQAGRVLDCVRRGDVDAPTLGLTADQAVACRFLLRRVDARFARPPRDPNADRTLGLRYAEGKAAPQDPVEALAWLRRAASAGDAPSMRELGLLNLWEPAGFHAQPPDIDERLQWLERAADAGDASAQHALAKSYAEGHHAARDPVRALAWATASAEQGHSEGRQLADELRQAMSDEDRRASERYLRGRDREGP